MPATTSLRSLCLVALAASLLALGASACANKDTKAACTPGSLGCACRADGACDNGRCIEQVCQSGEDGDPAEAEQEQEEAATPCALDDWGPYGVGTTLLSLTDETREKRSLPTLVLYPTATRPDYAACEASFFAQSSYLRYGAATICAVENAAPERAAAPYPVVFLSHGSGSQKEGYTYLEEFLVSHGFIVVAMDHTGNVGMMQSSPTDKTMSLTRVLDLRVVMDQLIERFKGAASPLGGLGDAERIGVSGHSWGGHAAVVLSGMSYNYAKIKTECDAGTQIDDYACPLLAHQKEIEALIPDSRIKAVVSWAQDIGKKTQPAGPNCFGAPGVKIPWLMMLGDTDNYVDAQEDGQDCYDKASGKTCMVLLREAGHMGYTDLGNEGKMDDARMLKLARFYSTAFFLRHLKGQQNCQAAMSAQAATDGADHTLQCKGGDTSPGSRTPFFP